MTTRHFALPLALLTGAFLLVHTPPGHAQTKTSPPAAPPASAPNSNSAAPIAVYTRPVAKGVNLTQEVIPDGSPNGPLVITVVRVRINLKEPGVKIEAALGGDKVWENDLTMGREVVSTLAVRHNAVAGVNAGFFPFMGNPIGLHVQNGEIVTEPFKNRSAFYVDKAGVAHIRAFTFSGVVHNTQTGESIPLSGMNRKAALSGDTLLLYTPTFFDKTLQTRGRTETVLTTGPTPLTGGRDFQSVPSAPVTTDGQTPLLPGTMVLSGSGAGAEFLKKSADAKQMLSLRLDVHPLPNPGETVAPPFDIADVRDAVTGACRLLTNGKVTILVKEEGEGQAFSTTRHPRTAVGIARNGDVLLVTVDGRQKNLSRGASLPELAQILLKYGAVDAVNLDGGGSSACIVRGLVVNSPSEGKERPVANALLVRADNLPASHIRPGEGSRMYLPARALKTGEAWDLLPFADRRPNADVGVWGTRGGVGFVFQNGRYLAQRPGAGQVAFAPPDGRSPLSAPITIVGAGTGDAAGFMAKLTVMPDTTNPLRATLFIHIANAEGDPLSNETVMVSVSDGKPDSPTAATNAKGDVQIGITWNSAGVGSGGREVTVSSPAKRFGDAKNPVLPAPKPGS